MHPNRRKKTSRFEVPGTGAILGALVVLALLLLVGLSTSQPSSPARPPEPTPERPSMAQPSEPTPTPPPEPEPGCPEGCTASSPGCEIKGNISQRREKIYHLPSQRYYGQTVISPEKGERWFCTEQEARANGWRKSKR